MKSYKSFGELLQALRHEKEETVRMTAEKLDISPGYYNDIEKNRRVPPENGFLEKIEELYHLDDVQKVLLNDLAGEARKEVSPDLPEYIMENDVVRVALRIAKEKANTDDWKRFIRDLENK